MHFLLYLIAVVVVLIGSIRYWFWLAPAYGFVLQFYLGLAVIVSLLYHVVILDAFGIAVTIMLIAYYGTSRAGMTFPGSYWPEFFGNSEKLRRGCEDYFGAFEIRGSENIKNPDKQHIVAIHPHGPTAFSRTFFACGFRDLLSRPSRMIGASVLFYLPVVREVTLWFGALDAGKETVEMLLQAGANVELYPGALDEMLQPGDKTINVKTRLGFLRLALRHGVDVLPCFCFGETNIQDLLVPPFAAAFKKMFRVGLILPIGRFYSFVPYKNKPQYLVIGEPIVVDHVAEPSEEQVSALHEQYKAAIAKVFEDNKRELGHEDYSLNIV